MLTEFRDIRVFDMSVRVDRSIYVHGVFDMTVHVDKELPDIRALLTMKCVT